MALGPTELTGMWGWILLRSPHQGRGSPPAPAPTKQRPGGGGGVFRRDKFCGGGSSPPLEIPELQVPPTHPHVQAHGHFRVQKMCTNQMATERRITSQHPKESGVRTLAPKLWTCRMQCQ